MAGFTTIDTVIARVKALIAQYLATETALIDTRNNAVGDDANNSFTTPTLAAGDFQLYVDQSHAPVTLTVQDGGSVSNRQYQMTVGGLTAGTAPDATLPRLDRAFRVEIVVRASAKDSTGGPFGARRICNRVADAAHVIMMRYPDLSIPATSKTGIVSDCDLVSDSLAPEFKGDEMTHWSRVLAYDVRLIESRT